MVCGMGLLDDAIHEHLELKRLRGADPSEVIQEEREAFGPVLRGEGAEPTAVADFAMHSTIREGSTSDEAEVDSNPDLSCLGEETVELDMRAVLEMESIESNDRARSDPLLQVASAAPSRARMEPPPSRGDPLRDFLEWEVPGKRTRIISGRLREEKSAPDRPVRDSQEVPAGYVLDSLHAASSKEPL
jgi:hypothetical protein